MPCPECGRVYCDHTAEQRGETPDEMAEDMKADAEGGWERVAEVNTKRGFTTSVPPDPNKD